MFDMPIIRSEFFTETTHQVIEDFLDAEHVFEGTRIIAMITDYQIHHEDRERVTPNARLDFLGETEDGRLRSCDPRRFQGSDLRAAFATVAAAWATDDLACQSAGAILPHISGGLTGDVACGKLYRHIQGRGFALYGLEYPANAAARLRSKPAGPKGAQDWRGFYMNLLLPPAETAHERVEEAASHMRIEDLARRIYELQMDGQEDEYQLAPFDFTKAKDAR
jgi:hypothetical protein